METLGPAVPARNHLRNPLWPERERAFLNRNPACAVCGLEGPVVAHHILPVPYCLAVGRPDLELDERNLIPLCHATPRASCEDHHLYVGHLGDYHSFNLRVREDATGRFKGTRRSRLWFSVERINSLQETLAAFPHLGTMTDAQMAALRRRVDELFPPGPGN